MKNFLHKRYTRPVAHAPEYDEINPWAVGRDFFVSFLVVVLLAVFWPLLDVSKGK